MEKRVFIAVLLSIAVMYGYSYLVPAPPKSPAVQQQQPVQQQVSAVQPLLPGKPVLAVAQMAPAVSAREVVVETELYTAVLSTSGAAVKRLVLKKYKTTTGPDAREITLIGENSPENFTLRTIGNGLPIDPAAVYSVNAGALRLAKGEKKSLEFTYASPQGVYLKKIFSFSGDGYAIGLEEQLGNTSGAQLAGTLQLIEKNSVVATPGDSRFEIHGPVTHVDNAVKEEKIGDLAKGAISFEKNVLWSGFADKYFLGAVIAEKGSIATVQIRQSNGYVENVISSPRITLAPGASAAIFYRLYFGPKDLEILKAQGSKLEEVIDFGWFSMLAKPLILSLKFLYNYTHNYGIAIIIITVILKLLFFPLTHKSYKSMKEMQKLQPKMAALKEKHKNDRDAMNKAVMELYKTHKVNPMGGCLPMVVQIPVFFALYKALMFSIELRHAPFMLWIKDLSGPDALISQLLGLPFTLGPLPLLMGVTMFIQQKMTPTSMDPMQAKIMLALPVVFTFMFLNFPSGLVLYWLVNNVLTIAQQWYINKTLKDA